MKKPIIKIMVALSVITLAIPHSVYAKTKIYVDAGHGCAYQSSGEAGPYGFTSCGANGEALYVGGFSNHLINSFNHTDRYEAAGISALSLPDGTVGDRELFGNTGRRDLFMYSDYDIMMQIHYDYSGDSHDTGGHIIWSHNSKDSGVLARCIANRMEENGLRLLDRVDDHISERHELSIYQEPTNKPIILIEVGFGTDAQLDSDYIRDKQTKKLFYKSIINGTDDYIAYRNSREGIKNNE